MSEQEQAVATPADNFPATEEQLHTFVTKSLGVLLGNPANALLFARTVLQAALGTVEQQIKNKERDMLRPVVIKTEYPNSIRATILANDPTLVELGGEPLLVDFTERDETASWVPSQLEPVQHEILSKLVLSTSQAVPGEIFFLTTAGIVDQAFEAVVDTTLAAADKANAFEAPAEDAPLSVDELQKLAQAHGGVRAVDTTGAIVESATGEDRASEEVAPAEPTAFDNASGPGVVDTQPLH